MYSQKSYPKTKLGSCSDTISQSGCFLTSFCNLLEYLNITKIDPPTFNKKAFPSGNCLANASYWASLYELSYEKTANEPKQVCIAETDNYKKLGVPQHFFLYDPKTKKRIDPLDLNPQWEQNTYHIVSFRVFTLKNKNYDPIKKAEKAPQVVQKIEVPVTPEVILTKQDSPILEPAEALPSVVVEVDKPQVKTWYEELIELILNWKRK